MEQRDHLMFQIEQMAQALGVLLQRMCALPTQKPEKTTAVNAIQQDWQNLCEFNPATTKNWDNQRFENTLKTDPAIQPHLATLGHLFFETALLATGDEKQLLLQRTRLIYEHAVKQQTHYDISLHGRIGEITKLLADD
jgi:hypothetical protein